MTNRCTFLGAFAASLRVDGNSMKDAGILDGELPAVDRAAKACQRNGRRVDMELGLRRSHCGLSSITQHFFHGISLLHLTSMKREKV
jgi:hypothetical protein